MATDQANASEKKRDPRVLAREHFGYALPQRMAYMQLFGSQFVLPEDGSRRSARPGQVSAGIPQRIAMSMVFGRQVLTSRT